MSPFFLMNVLRMPLLALASLTILVASAQAQAPASSEPADQFFRGYLMKSEAEKLENAGETQSALALYRQMAQIFDGVAQTYPNWQPDMLNNRRQLTQNAIARLQSKSAAPAAAPQQAAPAPTAQVAPQPQYQQPMAQAAAPAPSPGFSFAPQSAAPAPGGMVPAPGVLAAPANNGSLPSFGDTLRQLDTMYQQRFQELDIRARDLDVKNRQMEADLGKWQQWYQWASGEITAARADKDAIAQKLTALEKSAQQIQNSNQMTEAAAAQLEELKNEKVKMELEARKANQRLAAAENAAKEASEKLAMAAGRVATLEEETSKFQAERDKLIAERDKATKERDTLSTENLGMKTELEELKDKTSSKKLKTLTEENTRLKKEVETGKLDSAKVKTLMAENERLKTDLEAAQKQVATLKADVTRKDEEIASLRGQLTTLQGELATLRQQSGTYQTQVADLTRQLKELKEAQASTSGVFAKENETLREIVMRQLRNQYRQQQAKELVIAELNKMENASQDLIRQVEELKSTRMILTPEEEKLFTDPQVQEMQGQNGMQATLMASASKSPDVAVKKAAPKSTPAADAEALILKGNESFSQRRYGVAASQYEDALRAEAKNTTALVGLGLARQREGKLNDAEAALKKCLTIDPDNEPAAFALGITMFKQQRWNDAITWFERSLEKRPQNASARHYLGILSTKLNLMERAEREFKTALAIDPEYGEAHFNLAVLYITWDPPQWDKAQSEYKEAVKKGVKPDASLEKLLDSNGAKVSAR